MLPFKNLPKIRFIFVVLCLGNINAFSAELFTNEHILTSELLTDENICELICLTRFAQFNQFPPKKKNYYMHDCEFVEETIQKFSADLISSTIIENDASFKNMDFSKNSINFDYEGFIDQINTIVETYNHIKHYDINFYKVCYFFEKKWCCVNRVFYLKDKFDFRLLDRFEFWDTIKNFAHKRKSRLGLKEIAITMSISYPKIKNINQRFQNKKLQKTNIIPNFDSVTIEIERESVSSDLTSDSSLDRSDPNGFDRKRKRRTVSIDSLLKNETDFFLEDNSEKWEDFPLDKFSLDGNRKTKN